MGRIKNVIEKAEAMTEKINPAYDISCMHVAEIYEGSGGDWYRSIANGFKIGYMQGMKAAKAEMKKGGAVNV